MGFPKNVYKFEEILNLRALKTSFKSIKKLDSACMYVSDWIIIT